MSIANGPFIVDLPAITWRFAIVMSTLTRDQWCVSHWYFPGCCDHWTVEVIHVPRHFVTWTVGGPSKPQNPTRIHYPKPKKKSNGNCELLFIQRLIGGNCLWELWVALWWLQCLIFCHRYPVVKVYTSMEHHHAINGKTHELSVAIFNGELLVITRGLKPIQLSIFLHYCWCKSH